MGTKRYPKGQKMGETMVVFDEKEAKIEPASAARIGSGFVCIIKGHMIPFMTFDEAMSAALAFVFGKSK